MKKIEKLAEQLHIWYLEACQDLTGESYNALAQCEYKDLTNDQKDIDRLIAEKIIIKREESVQKLKYMLCKDCGRIPTADIIDKVSKIFGNKI